MATTGWINLGPITSEYGGLCLSRGHCEGRLEYGGIIRNNANSVTMTSVKMWHRYIEEYWDQASGLKYAERGFRIGMNVPDGGTEKWGYIGSPWEYGGSSGHTLLNMQQWYVEIPSVTFWVASDATGVNVRLYRNATDTGHLWNNGGYAHGLVWINIPPVPHIDATATGSSTNETDESNPWISYYNPSGTPLEAKLELPNLGDYSLVGSLKNIGSATSGTYTWSLEEETRERIRQLMTNDKQAVFRHTLRDLYSGLYTWKDSVITITNSNPTFSDFAYEDKNANVIAITGDDQIILKNESILKILIPEENKATPKKHATMQSYRFVCDGEESTTGYKSDGEVSVVLPTDKISAGSITVEAIDSRGDKTSVIKTISQIIPYEKPKINVSANRLNGFSNTTTINLAASISLIKINDVVKNQVNSLQWRRKQANSSSWSDWEDISFTLNQENGQLVIEDFSRSFDNGQSWTIEAKIVDRLKTVTATFDLSAGSPLLFIETDGRVAIGGLSENNKPEENRGQLEVFGDIYANGNKVLENKSAVVKSNNIDFTSMLAIKRINTTDNQAEGTGYKTMLFPTDYFKKGDGIIYNNGIFTATRKMAVKVMVSAWIEVQGGYRRLSIIHVSGGNSKTVADGISPYANGLEVWASVQTETIIDMKVGDELYAKFGGSGLGDKRLGLYSHANQILIREI